MKNIIKIGIILTMITVFITMLTSCGKEKEPRLVATDYYTTYRNDSFIKKMYVKDDGTKVVFEYPVYGGGNVIYTKYEYDSNWNETKYEYSEYAGYEYEYIFSFKEDRVYVIDTIRSKVIQIYANNSEEIIEYDFTPIYNMNCYRGVSGGEICYSNAEVYGDTLYLTGMARNNTTKRAVVESYNIKTGEKIFHVESESEYHMGVVKEAITAHEGGLVYMVECNMGCEEVGGDSNFNEYYIESLDTKGNRLWRKFFNEDLAPYKINNTMYTINDEVIFLRNYHPGTWHGDEFMRNRNLNTKAVAYNPKTGEEKWSYEFKGEEETFFNSIIYHEDSYYFLGSTSINGGVMERKVKYIGGDNIFIAKLNSNGEEEWNWFLYGHGNDVADGFHIDDNSKITVAFYSTSKNIEGIDDDRLREMYYAGEEDFTGRIFVLEENEVYKK